MNFDTIGIVCEYNPFHFGHKFHIEKTKELTGCKNIVCIMSGSMVQRGECAIFDKWQRAKAAVDAGADLVIELPAYYALQSADIFAAGAIEILSAMNVIDGISFGCECGDIDTIKKAAIIMTSKNSDYDTFVKEYINNGIGYPKASQMAISRCMPDDGDDLFKPNNTLAISYVKAIINSDSDLVPMCVKRDNDYHGSSSNDGYLSASEIRSRIISGISYGDYAPDYANENIFDLKNAEGFILGYLRTLSPDKITATKGGEDGLANLVCNSAKKACTLDELFEMCVTKRYTLHRIKRYIMCIVLGIDYEESPGYLRVLAIGKNGRKLLSEIKRKSQLDIVTKTADYTPKGKMFLTDIKATDFAALCSSDVRKRYAGRDYVTSPCVINI